ncbi:MAG: hypothetical protein ACI8P9_003542 [Parasphingorhabdus sp.]|jgi:hypothetical protein
MNELMSTLETLASLQSNKLEDIGILVFLVILLTSGIASYVVSLFYLGFFGGNSTGSQIHRAFPLLGVSITAIFISIQFSLPLSLGLLGALSIVRFRTPIKEPEEIGFIMLVVALSISCAIFNFSFVFLLLIVSLGILVFLKTVGFPLQPSSKNGLIVISLPQRKQQSKIADITGYIAGAVKSHQLESVNEGAEGSVVITYRVSGSSAMDVDGLLDFVKGLDENAIAELYLDQN